MLSNSLGFLYAFLQITYLVFDDIHWNPQGIAPAAAAIREKWPLPGASCNSPGSPVARKR